MKRNVKSVVAVVLTAAMILTSNASAFAAQEIGAAQAAAVEAQETSAEEQAAKEAAEKKAAEEKAAKEAAEKKAAEEKAAKEKAAKEAAEKKAAEEKAAEQAGSKSEAAAPAEDKEAAPAGEASQAGESSSSAAVIAEETTEAGKDAADNAADESGKDEEAGSTDAEAELSADGEAQADETAEDSLTEDPAAEEAETAEETAAADAEKAEEATPTPTPVPTKRVYSGSAAGVTVTATLERADAVPDDAKFVVAQTNKTEDTLYYDIHFSAPVKDDKGNVTGWQEYEPENGSVSISFRFNNNQLTDTLGAEEASDVTVVHVHDSGAEETLAASVSLSGSTDRVSFTTDSFSIYYFKVTTEEGTDISTDKANQKNTWNNDGSGTDYTIDQIIGGLKVVSEYSVYANTLKSRNHIEGNIAAGVFDTNAGESLNALEKINKGNELESLVIVKNVDGGPDGTFKFNLTDKEGKVVVSFEITTKDGTGSIDLLGEGSSYKNTIIEALKKGALNLNELDDKGNKVVNGHKFTKAEGDTNYTYEVTYSTDDGAFQEESNQIAATALSNLIGTFVLTEGTITAQQGFFGPTGTLTYLDKAQIASVSWSDDKDDNDLIITMKNGQVLRIQNFRNVVPVGEDGTKNPEEYLVLKDDLTSTISSNLDKLATFSTSLANAKNGPASGSAPENAGAVNVINLQATKGELRQDLIEAGFNISGNGSGQWLTGLLEKTGYDEIGVDESGDQYLIINIDCTGLTEYTLGELFIDGYSPNSNQGFSKLSSHIVYNFVQRDADGNFVPFTGTVKNNSVTGGTVMAPKAKVIQSDGFWGGVYADEVDRSGTSSEIHKKTITSTSRAVTTSVANTTESVEAYLETSKALIGRDLKAGEFSFVLTTTNNAPLPTETYVSNSASGAVKFGPIKYASVGTYTYEISEINDGKDFIDYDGGKVTATVTVSTVGEGENMKLAASVSYGEKKTFTNTYHAKGSTTFAGTKSIEGRALTSADTFTFEVTDGTNTWTAENGADGKIAYPVIEYTLDDVGPHTYTVKETSAAGNGITPDSTEYTVTVNVSDNGDGTLKIEKSENADTLDFKNKYEAEGEITFEGTKSMKGRALDADDIFTFEIKEGTKTWTATNDATGKINYPTISYTLADVGTHTYTVRETSTDANGVKVDTNSYTVVVTVNDNGDGTLKAEASDNATALNFTNTYGSSTSITFEGTKKIDTRDLTDKDIFSFEVSDGKNTWTATNDASGKISYPEISYTNEDAGKTFTYTVKETSKSGKGITVDENIYTVKVKVTDDGEGHLKAERTDTNGDLDFTNKYAATGSVTFEGTKTLSGRKLKDNEFEFTVTVEEDGGKSWTVKNNAQGKIVYPTIDYTLADLGKHSYKIKETSKDGKGVTVDKTEYSVTVNVSDNGDGTLKVTKSANATKLNFKNSYEATGTLEFAGTKSLEGRDLTEDDVFTFEIREGSALIGTAKNDASGAIDYPSINYTLDDIGTHAYTVKETSKGENGVTVDTNSYTVTVKISDNGDGTLKIEKSGDDPMKLDFVNTYKAKETSVDFGGTKTFENFPEDSTIVPKFEFTMSEDGKVIDTQEVEKQGEFKFRSITYTEEGTHTYTIAETKGSQAGVTYDTNTYTVKVEVKDNKEGKLVATVTGDNPEKLDFTNSYKAAATEVEFSGMKTLSGRDLKPNEFSFTLTGSDGTNKTVKNADGGKIDFGKIEYTKADTYTYEVKEEASDADGITIDSTVYKMTVKATDDGSGKLKAEVTGADPKALNFANSYKAGSTSVNFGGTKTFENFPEDSTIVPKFEFTMSEDGKVIDTQEVEKQGEFKFKSITYTEEGTHTYTIAETKGGQGGVTYDTKTYTVKVEVKDNKEGKLVATVTGDNPEKLDFTNSYKAAATEVEFSGMKTLSGRDLEPNEFSFMLTGSDGTNKTVKNADGGKIDFGKIEYTKADTYTYEVKEEASDADGITIDSTVYKLTVKVTDDGSGQLKAEVTGADPKALNFANSYKAGSTSVNFGGTKTFENFPEDSTIVPKFEFTMSEDGKVIDTQEVEKQGEFKFKSITYDKEGTHTYTIAETKGSQGGVTYDTKTYTVKVEVKDNKEGKLVATVTGDNPEKLDFTNSYKAAETSIILEGTKTLTGRDLKENEFAFEVREDEDVVATGTNAAAAEDEAGAITFTEIKYTEAGEHTYTVTEVATDEYGVTQTGQTSFTVKVKVTDDGSGQLAAELTEDSEKIAFTNKSEASVKVSKVDVADGKELEGATIQILDKDGNVVAEWTSTTEAHEVTDLRTGVEYTLHEEVAPTGYAVTADTTFTIDEEGNVTSSGTVTSDGVLLVEDAFETNVNVTKKMENGDVLPGAKLKVETEDGTTVDEWTTTDGPHTVAKLTAGTYKLIEVEVPNAEYFKKAADITFVVDGKGVITVDGKVVEELTMIDLFTEEGEEFYNKDKKDSTTDVEDEDENNEEGEGEKEKKKKRSVKKVTKKTTKKKITKSKGAKTGDTTNAAIPMAAAGAAMAAALYILLTGRKRRER